MGAGMHKIKQVGVAVALAFAAHAASAAGVGTGSKLTLADSYGTNSGGEFIANVLTGPGAGASFITFCVEHNETFSPGANLYVKAVNTGTVNGGITNLDNGFVGASAPSANFDPISYQTAYLFTQFSSSALSNYEYGTSGAAVIAEHAKDATSLQRAFWYLEGERDAGTGNWGYDTDQQAKDWVTEATSANWQSLGNVRVLNLYKDASFTITAQDQLYMAPIPEPETYAMLLAGLGLMGFVARRRRAK